MSFIYPRKITIYRPRSQDGVGFQADYAGDQVSEENKRFSGVPASIQLKREGQKNPVGLPGDGTAAYWDVYIPRGALKDGDIKDRDILVDDLARRFQVVADESQGLGYRLRTQRLEA